MEQICDTAHTSMATQLSHSAQALAPLRWQSTYQARSSNAWDRWAAPQEEKSVMDVNYHVQKAVVSFKRLYLYKFNFQLPHHAYKQ